MIKTHIVGAFLIIGIYHFTRLVHFLVAPFPLHVATIKSHLVLGPQADP